MHTLNNNTPLLQSMGKENIDVNYIKNELEQRKSHIDVLRNENHKLTERLTTSEVHSSSCTSIQGALLIISLIPYHA